MKVSAGYRLQRVVGKAVRSWRRRRGLTQERLADLTGVEYKRLQKAEAGKVNLTLHSVARLAEALKVKADSLLRP